MNNLIPLTKEDIRPYRDCKPVVRLFKKDYCYVGNIKEIVLDGTTLRFYAEPIIRVSGQNGGGPIFNPSDILWQICELPNAFKVCEENALEGQLKVNADNAHLELSYRFSDVYAVGRLLKIHEDAQRQSRHH